VGEAFISVQEKLEESRRKHHIPASGKKLNSLDKMYDWEVNWRKLKLVQDQNVRLSAPEGKGKGVELCV
jgi:hypothetical protein